GGVAGDEGDVLADHDLAFFVIQGYQVGRGKNVGRVIGGECPHQAAQRAIAVEAEAQASVQADRRARELVEGVGLGGGADAAVQTVAVDRRAAGVPLYTQFVNPLVRNLDDHGLYQDLGATNIQPRHDILDGSHDGGRGAD